MMTVGTLYYLSDLTRNFIRLCCPNRFGFDNGVYLSNFEGKQLDEVLLLPVESISVDDEDLVLNLSDWYSFMGTFGK